MTDIWLEARDGRPGASVARRSRRVRAVPVGFVLREMRDEVARDAGGRARDARSCRPSPRSSRSRYSGSGASPVLLVLFAAQLAACVPMPRDGRRAGRCNTVVYFIFAATWPAGGALFATALYAGFQAFAVMTMRLAYEARAGTRRARARRTRSSSRRAACSTKARARASGCACRASCTTSRATGSRRSSSTSSSPTARRTRARPANPARDRARRPVALRPARRGEPAAPPRRRRHRRRAARARRSACPGCRSSSSSIRSCGCRRSSRAKRSLRCVQEALTNAARHAQARHVVRARRARRRARPAHDRGRRPRQRRARARQRHQRHARAASRRSAARSSSRPHRAAVSSSRRACPPHEHAAHPRRARGRPGDRARRHQEPARAVGQGRRRGRGGRTARGCSRRSPARCGRRARDGHPHAGARRHRDAARAAPLAARRCRS